MKHAAVVVGTRNAIRNLKRQLATAKKEGVKIVGVLTTHHHSDHAGGNNVMVELVGGEKPIPVYAFDDDRVQALSHKLADNDELTLGNVRIRVLYVPCHTTNSVLYVAEDAQEVDSDEDQKRSPAAVFTGDTLFIGGSGRFFEARENGGELMNRALNERFASLPDDTLVYVGHEYTIKNYQFGLTVEPDNEALRKALEDATQKREKGECTAPSTVAHEKATNVFMRLQQVRKQLDLADDASEADVMLALREKKNAF